MIPGTYEVRLLNDFTPYIAKDVHITQEERQDFSFVVPMGHVTFLYQKPDGSKDKAARFWIRRLSEKKTFYHSSDQLYAFLPGEYVAIGYSYKGDYEEVSFSIREGEEQTVILRAK